MRKRGEQDDGGDRSQCYTAAPECLAKCVAEKRQNGVPRERAKGRPALCLYREGKSPRNGKMDATPSHMDCCRKRMACKGERPLHAVPPGATSTGGGGAGRGRECALFDAKQENQRAARCNECRKEVGEEGGGERGERAQAPSSRPHPAPPKNSRTTASLASPARIGVCMCRGMCATGRACAYVCVCVPQCGQPQCGQPSRRYASRGAPEEDLPR